MFRNRTSRHRLLLVYIFLSGSRIATMADAIAGTDVLRVPQPSIKHNVTLMYARENNAAEEIEKLRLISCERFSVDC